MKRLLFVILGVTLLVGSVYPKEKKKTQPVLMTLNESKIAEFKKERGGLFNRVKEYEDAIQNCKYRIAQLNFGIELLEGMEEKKK